MLVSVIIPVYNVEKYLVECIESVLAQTMADFELLLIDDGSKDSSGEICDRYAARDHRIRVFHFENGGVSKARNRGLDLAQGEFVVFVDSDDWIEPNHLETLLEKPIGEHSIVFINAFLSYTLQLEEQDANGDKCRSVLINLRRKAYFGWMWNKIFSRRTIERHGLRFKENMRLHEDELFTVEYCRYVTHVRVSNRQTYHYRSLKTGLLRASIPLDERLSCYRKLYRTYYNLDAENRYLTSRIHLANCYHALRRCWQREKIRLTMLYLNAAYDEYLEQIQPEYLRDGEDHKIVERSHMVFRFRNNWWVWMASKFIKI